ncbi:protein of unknown function [Agreia sp. COWG]|nr:protein of unknown function [Agreia sp. COWG]
MTEPADVIKRYLVMRRMGTRLDVGQSMGYRFTEASSVTKIGDEVVSRRVIDR